MYFRIIENRSDNDYGYSDSDTEKTFVKWYDILLFPIYFVALCIFAIIVMALK